MFSEGQKFEAVKLYKKTGSIAVTIRILGYPNNDSCLRNWINEFKKTGIYEKLDVIDLKLYSQEDIDFACKYYDECKDLVKTFTDLGYPSDISILHLWISSRDKSAIRKQRASSHIYSLKEKEDIIREFFSSGLSQNEFARQLGVAPSSVSVWKRQVGLTKEDVDIMPRDDEIVIDDVFTPPRTDQEEINELKKEIAKLKAEKITAKQKTKEAEAELKLAKAKLAEAQLEYDILEKAAELLKKVNGINIKTLKNKEKAIVINALRNKYKLAKLLKSMKMAKSSYEYQVKFLQYDKYKDLRQDIRIIFEENYQAYGSERIHGELKKQGKTVSEKVIRRLMKEENIHPFIPRMKKYSSYQGEISPSVPDLYKHDFKADSPYKKTVTDITEFSLRDGKVYLSPMIDLFDGCPINWKIGTSPNKELTNSMLIEFHDVIPSDARPIIHSDRGAHYRIADWINLMEEYGYTRSMSRKGCSPDNAACEGFFGILKREFFHNHDWSNVTKEEFIKELDKYLTWFKIKRIKERLGYLSPTEYRSRASL